jgi:ABC-2 type transport system permease protein
MTALRALMRKEAAVLFGSPVAYLVLTMVALLTAITFFEHLRLYNQQLFLYASTAMGGFESGTVPDYINLRDTVFNPVMDQLGVLLIIPIPLVTMRVFAEERARGTDELLLTSGLSPLHIVSAKFAVTFGFVVVLMAVSFIYPVTAIVQGGLGFQHLMAVYLGMVLLGLGLASLGLVCSAYTSSQIIAAAGAAAAGFLLYDFGWTAAIVGDGAARFLDAISLRTHFSHFAEGVVYLADLVYFAVVAVIAGAIARLSFDFQRAGA